MATTVSTVNDLIAAINSRTKTIIVQGGQYEIPPGTTLKSTVESRKIIGSGTTPVNIIFTNIPDNSVCLDFQNKSRIYKINIIMNSFVSSTPTGVIGVRFKRQIAYTYEKIGESTSFINRPPISGNSFTVGTVTYTYSDSKRYYYEVKNPSAATSKQAYSFYVFGESEVSGTYEWILDAGSDQGDMDSSFMDCAFTTPVSPTQTKGVVGVDYHARNMECDQCTFTNVGTAIRLQFPQTSLLSSPGSTTNPNQSGFYGHRKARIYRGTFNTVSRCLHLTGSVTVRGLIMTNNTVTGGQLLFCDGAGGIKSSIISNNTVTNHSEQLNPDYNRTIQFNAGVCEDNIFSFNKFQGSPSAIIRSANPCIMRGNIFSQNTFGPSVYNGFNIEKPDGICITNNTFSTSPITSSSYSVVTLYNGGANELVCSNKITTTDTKVTNFIRLTGNHSKVLATRNTIPDKIPNSMNIITSTTPITSPFFIQKTKS